MVEEKYENVLLAPGTKACAGCGPLLGLRYILEATGPDIVVCIATGCMEVTTTQYPQTAWRVPLIHVTFENVASVASGVSAALRMQWNEHTQVIALGGDGAIVDIGFGAVSGAMERNDDIIIICYDNEAYQNTGNQRSGATPLYAYTTTSPVGLTHGKQQPKKNMLEIAVAHGISYVASASIAFHQDLKTKIQKAMKIKGCRYIHVHVPCPVGWGFDSSETIEIAKLAVETNMWQLYEVEDGSKKITVQVKKKPVSEYLLRQKRFQHLTEREINKIQEMVDKSES